VDNQTSNYCKDLKVGTIRNITRNIFYYIGYKPTFKPNLLIVNSTTKEVLLANMINDYRIYHELPTLKMDGFNNCQANNWSNEYIQGVAEDKLASSKLVFEKQFKLVGLDLINSIIVDDEIKDYQRCFQFIIKNTILKLIIMSPNVKYIGISIKNYTREYPTFSLVLSR
jgi:hypothetical protein